MNMNFGRSVVHQQNMPHLNTSNEVLLC